MAGIVTVHILGDTRGLSRAINRAQRHISDLNTSLGLLNRAATGAAIGIAAIAAAGVGAGAVAGGLLLGGAAAAAGGLVFLATKSKEVEEAMGSMKKRMGELSAELTKPMHQPLIKFFGTLTDIFEHRMGPSITRMSKQMDGFLGTLGEKLGPVAENVGLLLESMFTNGQAALFAFVDGLNPVLKGMDQLFKKLNNPETTTFVTLLMETLGGLLPILGDVLNALIPVGNEILRGLNPAIEQLSVFIREKFVPMMQKVTEFLRENPKFIAQLVTAIIALKVALIAVQAVLGLVMLAKLSPVIALFSLLGFVLAPLIPMLKEGFVRVMDAARATLDRLRPAFDKLVEVIRGHLIKVFDRLVALMPTLMDTFAGLFEALTPVIDVLLDVGVMIFNELVRVLQALLPVVVEVANAIGEYFNKNIGENRELIQQLVTKLGDMLIALIPLIPKIMDLVLWLGEKLIDAIIWLGPHIFNLADSFISAAGNVGTFLDKLKEITTVLDGVIAGNEESKTRLLEIWEEIKVGFKEKVTQIAEDNGITWDGVQTKLSEVWQHIKDNFVGWIDSLENSSADGFDTITKAIKTVWSEDLAPFLSRQWEDIKDEFGMVMDEWKTDAAARMKKVGNAIINYLSGLPFDVFDIGLKIVNGFWDGIAGARGWLYEKVKGFASGVLTSMKNALGIRSPSREAAKLGVFFGEGFADGMKQEEAAIARAARMLGTTAIGGLKKTSSGMGGVLSAGLSGGRVTIQAGASVNGGGGNTFNITVEAGMSNPEETGRAVVHAIRDYERINGRQWRE